MFGAYSAKAKRVAGMRMALAGPGFSLRRTGVLANSGTAEDQSGAMPTIVATAIRHDPTNAKTVLLLLILGALATRWITYRLATIQPIISQCF